MALYGERAALQLRGNLPHGLVATITLPMQPGGART
jgi:hypothetical protein